VGQRFTPLLVDAARPGHRRVHVPTAGHGRCPPVLPTRHRHDEVTPIEVTTDRAAAYRAALDDLLPATWHRTDQHANNRLECDHGRLKARLRSMRGLKQDRSATVVLSGHALVQNLRRGHYELAVEEPASLRDAAAFDELALAI
jgi:DDE superfamily endonuclease